MTSVLCPPPSGDPRPRRLDIATCVFAVTRHTEIAEWAARRKYSADPDYAILALAEAIEHANGDPDRTVRALTVLHQWDEDFFLRNHASAAIRGLDECWMHLILKWVVRTGMRFPGDLGDLVIFFDGEHQRKGRVKLKQPRTASALVESENGTTTHVMAEHVVANLTRGVAANGLRIAARQIPPLAPIETAGDRPCDSGE